MTISTADTLVHPHLTPKPRFLDAFARRILRAHLRGLRFGELILLDGHEREVFGERSPHCALSATVRIHDPRFWTEIAFGGSIGAGEAYMLGYWSAEDLTTLIRLLIRNRPVLDAMDGGATWVTTPLQKALHFAARNTRAGSRRNIAAHYDLGNEFFALFLDPTMMYSSAIFTHAAMTLEQAQRARLDLICRKLNLHSGDHVLEIGSGWGAMAIHAAQHFGCRVTTTTISRQQYEFTQQRVRAAGLQDRVTVLLQDYRDLCGRYDKLVSIEMIEAVGHQYYDEYMRQCSALLKPEGLMLLQAITIPDQHYDAARRSVDFIQRHIFPGSCIPSVTALVESMTRASDLRVVHLDDIGLHYATTLRRWRGKLLGNVDKVRDLGLSDRFIRMWEFYFCYCEGGFAERAISNVQMLLAKPAHGIAG